MYFWKIKSLQSELSKQPLSQIDAFKYLLLFALLYFIKFFPSPSKTGALLDLSNGVLWINYIVILISISLELFFSYKANGGRYGKDFLGRYLSIRTVTFIRYFFFFKLLYIPIFIVQALPIASQYSVDGFYTFDFLVEIKPSLFYLAFYWDLILRALIIPFKTIQNIRGISVLKTIQHQNS